MNPYTVYGAINSELEMTLALLSALAVLLSLNGSPLAYPVAFLTAATKWDSVFAVPPRCSATSSSAGAFVFAVVAGGLAASGVAVWMLLGVFATDYSNPYVREIASRGPNVYRYIVDCFLILSGYVPWMATHAYFSDGVALRVPLFTTAGSRYSWCLPRPLGSCASLHQAMEEIRTACDILRRLRARPHGVPEHQGALRDAGALGLVLLFFFGMCEGLYPWLRKYAVVCSGGRACVRRLR